MKKIILVEDNPAMVEIYREYFRKTGYDVELAKNAREIIQEFASIKSGQSEKPDLILMDLMLPYAGGVDILKTAKKDENLKGIPIFVFSNYENPDVLKDLERENIKPEKYLIKTNHTPAELIGIIKDHFSREEEKRKTNLA
jgi:CheY-like chemotaxis protein